MAAFLLIFVLQSLRAEVHILDADAAAYNPSSSLPPIRDGRPAAVGAHPCRLSHGELESVELGVLIIKFKNFPVGHAPRPGYPPRRCRPGPAQGILHNTHSAPLLPTPLFLQGQLCLHGDLKQLHCTSCQRDK